MLVKFNGTCAKCAKVELSEDGSRIESVRMIGGCPGNGQAVCVLLRGMPVDRAISLLRGIQCGERGTSCPDQLAQGLESLKAMTVRE